MLEFLWYMNRNELTLISLSSIVLTLVFSWSQISKSARSCGVGFSCCWCVSIQHHIKALQRTPPKHHNFICSWRCFKTWFFTACFGYIWQKCYLLKEHTPFKIRKLTFCADTRKEIYLATLVKERGCRPYHLLYSWQLQLGSLKPQLWFWGLEYSSTLWVSPKYVRISYIFINATQTGIRNRNY